jgi:hypothetical protein
VLPKLQPISRTLARELQREQRLRKRLKQQIGLLQRQLVLYCDNQSLLATDNSSNSLATLSSSSSVELYEEWGDDPLFSAATPPSLEQLQRKLVHVQRQLLQANSESLADVLTREIREIHGKPTVNLLHTACLLVAVVAGFAQLDWQYNCLPGYQQATAVASLHHRAMQLKYTGCQPDHTYI